MDTGDFTSRNRGYLPHWEMEEAIYFVTFRLADSLPAHVLDNLHFKYAETLAAAHKLRQTLSQKDKTLLRQEQIRRIEAFLDSGYGSCYLSNPEIAKLVREAILFFDGTRYSVLAWCIMPNHVHVVFKLIPPHTLASVIHTWKSYTARLANRQLNRSSVFWQREYFDHIIRSESQLMRIIQYISNNPIKAGLSDWPWVEIRERQLAELIDAGGDAGATD